MRRDPYEVLGVARDARRARDQEGLPPPRARAAPGREQPRPAGRGEVQGGRRGLRDPLRRRAPGGLRPLRLRGPRLARLRLAGQGFGSFADIFDAFFGGDPFGGASAAAAAPGASRAATWRWRSRSRSRRRRAATPVEVEYDAGGPLRALPRQRRRAGHADRDLPPLRRRGRLRAVTRTAFGQLVREQACDACGGEGRIPPSRARSATGRGRRAVRKTLEVDVPAGIADDQRIRLSGRGHAGERGGPPGDLYVLVRVTEDERFLRDGNDLVTVVDVPAPAAALGTTVTVPTLDGDEEIDVPAGTQPGTVVTLRGRGHADARPRPPRRPAGGAERGDPAQPQRRASASCSRSCATRSPRTTSRARPRVAAVEGEAGAALIRLAFRAPGRGTPSACWPRCSSWRPRAFEQVDGEGLVEFAALRRARRAAVAPPRARRRWAACACSVSGREVPDDWAERWRRFHRPVLVGGVSTCARPGSEPASAGGDRDRDRSRAGVRHRHAPHHAHVPGAAARAGAARLARRPRLRLGRARDRGRQARLRPGRRRRPRPAAIEATLATRATTA